jgi:hypothetical protein
MSTVWVYKFDGTIQCDTAAQEVPLDKMREELAALVGSENILSMKKDQRPMIQLCGMPTGKINCYELSENGWTLLSTGFPGTGGFQRVDEGPAESAENVNLGRIIGSLTASNPQTVQELVGHPLRMYKTGDMLTLDWRPNRCNIEVNESRVIVKVWFG